ncbi:oxidoreductase [Quadrisphaera sp. KR29]|uniref:oxidoreductase n=1 Tax=Quadrisphaera sp. KR29 TaxID=3461391 RepID=UPI004044BF43
MSTWLITGCSTGLGRALASAVLDRGWNAVVTARDPETVSDLVDAHPQTALAARLDVTDPEQVRAAVGAALERFGAVDVLVNNAGYGYRSALEEGEEDAVRALFDTNVHGATAMTKAVLPGMRERRSGAVVNISSIGAQLCPPGSGYYAATKLALEGLTGALRAELAPLGLVAMAVEPGGFRTDFAGRSLTGTSTVIDDYAPAVDARRKENDRVHGTQPGDPELAARAIIDAVTSPEPPALLLLGSDALQAAREINEARRRELEAWAAVSESTDIREG